MSAYNTVTTTARCPRCDVRVEVTVQFKYGDVWQHSYRLLDPLRWGGNDVGLRGARRVVVDGIAQERCPACGVDDEWSFEVHLEDDRIVRVRSATGEHDFARQDSTYIVLEEER